MRLITKALIASTVTEGALVVVAWGGQYVGLGPLAYLVEVAHLPAVLAASYLPGPTDSVLYIVLLEWSLLFLFSLGVGWSAGNFKTLLAGGGTLVRDTLRGLERKP